MFEVVIFIWFQGLKDENGRLRKLLGEKNEELRIFKQRWEREKRDLTGNTEALLSNLYNL